MSNTWFQFKKFIIHQDNAAMKVGTDGVLLGSWVNTDDCSRILDVGTGTGLLALMMAQRSKNSIDAIEIEPAAAAQAIENIKISPWPDQINVLNISFQEFLKLTTNKYDLIVCNPPFFKNSLKANSDSRILARHDDDLSLETLIHGSKEILSHTGRLIIILPFAREPEALSLALQNQLFISRILRIRPMKEKPYKRVILEFSPEERNVTESEMLIEISRHIYSDEYKSLTKNYLLNIS